MISIAEDLLKEIIKFVFCVVLAWLFFWTGEAIITVLCLGFHRPRWGGYSGTGALRWAFSETALVLLGFASWLAAFPLAYDLFV